MKTFISCVIIALMVLAGMEYDWGRPGLAIACASVVTFLCMVLHLNKDDPNF